MAEERNQVVPPVGSPLAPDLPVVTPLTGSELDDVDVPRSVSTSGLGPGGSADRLDVEVPPGTTATAGTGAAAASATDDPERIREEIERTREDMSQTINELQDRLSPQNLAQQARDSVREATVGRVQQMVGSASDKASEVARRAQDAAEPVMEQVRERPVSIALAGAGAGLAWWLMRRASSRQTWSREDMYNWDDDTMGTRGYSTGSRDYPLDIHADDAARARWQGDGGWLRVLRDNPVPASIAAASIGYMLWSRRSAVMSDDYVDMRSTYGDDYDEDRYGTSTTARVGESARDMGRQARDKASEIGQLASEKASALTQKASETASALSQKASEKANELSHKASEIGQQVTGTVRSARARAGQMTRHTSTQFDRWMQENPLAVGVAAMAAGAVVGLTVPATHAENRAMGASRDALVERATESAQQLKGQVQEKAQQLKEQVQEKVQEVADEYSSTASSTTSSPSSSPGMTGV